MQASVANVSAHFLTSIHLFDPSVVQFKVPPAVLHAAWVDPLRSTQVISLHELAQTHLPPVEFVVQASLTVAARHVDFVTQPPPVLVVHPAKYVLQAVSVFMSGGAVSQVLISQ